MTNSLSFANVKRIFNSYKATELSTSILTIVLLLQVFRRLSSVVYVAVLLLAYAFWIVTLPPIKCTYKIKTPIIAFLFIFALLVPIISLFTTSQKDYFTAILRYGAILPFMVLSILHLDVLKAHSKTLLRIYCLIIVLSALLMIYQLFFGKIGFFVDSTERLGYERYGSLLGSTTTYGTISVVGIIILYTFKPFKPLMNRLFELLIIVGGVLCLSKSFFLNLAIGYLLIFFLRNKGESFSFKKIIIGLFVFALIGIVFLIILMNTPIGKYFIDMFEYTFHNEYQGAQSDLLDRLINLPNEAFAYHKKPWFYYCLFGQGFIGYSGVLGLPDYPMCHNNYFEAILTGGFVNLFVLLFIYFGSFKKSLKSKGDMSLFVKRYVPYLMINMLIGAGSFVSTTGLILFVIILSYYNESRKTI